MNLQSLNLESNELVKLPNLANLEGLIQLKLSHNRLEEFPSSLCDSIYKKLEESSCSPIPIFGGGAVHLSELDASCNQIHSIPFQVSKLVALKILNLKGNKISSVPKELADCNKLKEVNLKDNPIKDRRLFKLIDQCPSKKILDYVRANCASAKPSQADVLLDKDNVPTSVEEEKEDLIGQINVVHNEDPFLVVATNQILSMRKIVVCILRNVNLTKPPLLKAFLALQTSNYKFLILKNTLSDSVSQNFIKAAAKIVRRQRLPLMTMPKLFQHKLGLK